jgi:hypothetical protein
MPEKYLPAFYQLCQPKQVLKITVLDTVAIKFAISPTPTQLLEWVGRPFIPPRGSVRPKYFQKSVMDNGAPVKYVFYPSNARYPDPHFRIEVSPSMVVFGNNVQMIEEQSQIDEAIHLIDGYLSRIPWIPPVGFGDGILFRIDATYNHPVGDRVHDYIKSLFNLEDDYPQRETRPWKYSGVQFYSEATTTTFYDLMKRHQIPFASGYLRQETSMRHTRNIEQRMGKENPTLRDMTIDWLAGILNNDLNVLHLNNTIICNRDLALEILMNKYGGKKGTRLYGYLITRQSLTKKELMAKGCGESTIRGWDKDLEEASIALAMTEKVSLPPLSIVVKAQKTAGGT